MHHRTAEFREIFSRTLADLKTFIGTNDDVLILASSGTGAMEAAVSNLTSPGEKVLVLSAGKFGERWRDLVKAYGCEVELLTVPYGETFDLREVKAKLDGVSVVYMQATETSTGARHDVKAIAALLKGTTRCWSWTALPVWAPRILRSTTGVSTSSSAARRKR